jgi:hypothetical protein
MGTSETQDNKCNVLSPRGSARRRAPPQASQAGGEARRRGSVGCWSRSTSPER